MEIKYPQMGEWIKKMWYIYAIECYLTFFKKEEIVSFATWVSLEDIMLNEISQAQKDKYHMISFMGGI
jgi:hypothetical protein